MRLVSHSTSHIRAKGSHGKRKSIEQIRTNIDTYKRRRIEYKEKYKHVFALPVKDRDPRDQANILRTLYNINMKLCLLNKSLILQMRKYKKIEAFNKIFTEYSGQDIKYWIGKRRNIQRRIIYKYLLESGVDGGAIVTYLGRGTSQLPSRGRRALNESFKTNPENYQAWRKFKSYIDANTNRFTANK